MSAFDVFRFQFGNAAAEEKLVIIRSEGMRLFNFIKGYTGLIEFELEEGSTAKITPEVKRWNKKVSDKVIEFEELILALTGPNIREKLGLPELRSYNTLYDAVIQVSINLKLPLAEALENGSLYFRRYEYPLVIQDSSVPQRQIIFQLKKCQYHIELMVLAEGNSFSTEGDVFLETLENVVIIIQRFLVEKYSASEAI